MNLKEPPVVSDQRLPDPDHRPWPWWPPAGKPAVVNLGKSWFTQTLPEYWLFALGLVFILVTLFLPRGIAGLAKGWVRKR